MTFMIHFSVTSVVSRAKYNIIKMYTFFLLKSKTRKFKFLNADQLENINPLTSYSRVLGIRSCFDVNAYLADT